jgi:hypothetical protein
VLLTLLALPAAGSACPVCSSDTGLQIRALAFGPDFPRYLAATLAPAPLLLGLVAGARLLAPWLLRKDDSE